MTRLTRQLAGPLAAACVSLGAALLGGCQTTEVSLARRYELAGSYHMAYEEYLKAASNGSNGAAAAGLRRTAQKASLHWLQKALAAAEAGQWELAALCHLKVLQIAPDTVSSILILRQLDRQHPTELERACRLMRIGRLDEELLAMTGESTEPTLAMGPVVARRPRESAGATPPAVTVPPPTSPPPPAPDDEEPLPTPKPAAPKPPVPATPPTPPAVETAAPKPPGPPTPPPPPTPRIDPMKQKPTVGQRAGAGRADCVMIVRVSRDDDRYPKQRDLLNGLAIKVRGTDDKPLSADMEVYLNGRRIAKLDDLRQDGVIQVVDAQGKPWELVIMEILDKDETVTVGVLRR